MQKYIKNDLSKVRYFEDDVKVIDWIDLTQYRLMTESEIIKHESDPCTNYHVWNDELLKWIDERTDMQIAEHRRSLLPSLTRYQFKRCLLENGYKTSDIESKILTIKDEMTRELTLLGFKEATNFVRTNDSILTMQSMLGLSDDKVDELWVYAMAL